MATLARTWHLSQLRLVFRLVFCDFATWVPPMAATGQLMQGRAGTAGVGVGGHEMACDRRTMRGGQVREIAKLQKVTDWIFARRPPMQGRDALGSESPCSCARRGARASKHRTGRDVTTTKSRRPAGGLRHSSLHFRWTQTDMRCWGPR